jgi:transcriptional regulator of NAD metabolism
METQERRQHILQLIQQRESPVSAASLARQTGVSRQVIVGDIALLRAQGSSILATARGYTMLRPAPPGQCVGKLACRHSQSDTKKELMTIVKLGGRVLDVIVEHYLYGEITGQLNISTPRDVDAFIRKLNRQRARLLSELTDGVHLHTIACPDMNIFETITAELGRMSLLYQEK